MLTQQPTVQEMIGFDPVKRNVLLMHHVEETWESPLRVMGYELDELIDQFFELIEASDFDQVILTMYDDWNLEECHMPIAHMINEVYTYSYGLFWDCVRDHNEGLFRNNKYYMLYGRDFCVGGDHSEVVDLPEWLHELRRQNCHVWLTGAFDGQCIEDISIAMDFLGIDYTRIEDLIV